MTDEKKVRELELEIRRLQLIIRLQGEIIDSYKELANISNGKLVIQ